MNFSIGSCGPIERAEGLHARHHHLAIAERYREREARGAVERVSGSYRVDVCIDREPLRAGVLLAAENNVDVGARGETFHRPSPARRAVLENHLRHNDFSA